MRGLILQPCIRVSVYLLNAVLAVRFHTTSTSSLLVARDRPTTIAVVVVFFVTNKQADATRKCFSLTRIEDQSMRRPDTSHVVELHRLVGAEHLKCLRV